VFGYLLPCTVIVGGFFGDEGKGKIAAYLAMKDKPDICVRGGNGPNAGHTVIHGGVQYSLRLIPSGFVNQSTRLLIGPGVPVDPTVLFDELRKTDSERRIEVDNQCAIVEPRHKEQESRSDHLSKKIMIEGTQGTFLSLYHGTYPYVTSKDTTASAACADVGVGPTQVYDVIVIFKAYVTRVGEGPLEGQLDREEVARRGWTEFGTVTGRERRAAPFDFKLARRAVQLNGATQIALTKLDVLFPGAKGTTRLDELDEDAREFVLKIEQETGVPVTLIGTGPGEEDIIDRRKSKAAMAVQPVLERKKLSHVEAGR
jgi:adenylosuccinate synthase